MHKDCGIANNDGAWRRFYQRWSVAVALFACAISVVVAAGADPAVVTAMVAVFVLAGLAGLYAGGRSLRRGFRPADLVSSLRSLTVCAVLVWLVSIAAAGRSLEAAQRWTILALLLAAELTDLFDGVLARAHGPTRFGAIWDMENDALFTFALSFLAHVWFGLGVWVMAIGLFRYFYFLAFRFPGDPADCPRSYKQFAKWVCAILVLVLIGLTAPVLSGLSRTVIAAIALTLQTVSFGWDLVLHLAYGKPGTGSAWSR